MVHSMHLHKAPAVVKIWKRHKQFKEQGYLHGPKVYDDTQEIVEKVWEAFVQITQKLLMYIARVTDGVWNRF